MNLIFLGPPGAGKGTQAARVLEHYGLVHISTGAMLRDAIAEGTEMGKLAKGYMDKGALVPDDVIIGIVDDRLKKPDCEKGYILDGFPRTVEQAEALEKMAEIDYAILVDVPYDRLMARMIGRRVCPSCGNTYHISNLKSEDCPNCGTRLIQRADDNEETVANRLAIYDAQTRPVIEFYQARGKLAVIDGDRPQDVVFESIRELLG